MRNKTRNFSTILFILITFLWGIPVYAQKPLKKPVRVVETKKVQRPKSFQWPQLSESVSGTVNGHDYVDLGLSVKWGTCNVGARAPEQYGDYFAWGETNTKTDYTESNCRTNYKIIGDISNSKYDVARVRWTNGWRLPTKEEFDELKKKCKMTWTSYKGVYGYLVERNGKTLFLPAAGSRYRESLIYADKIGYYWTSTSSDDYGSVAYGVYFHSRLFEWCDYCDRYAGRSVRPVHD